MLNLEMYSLRDLQTIAGFIRQSAEAGFDSMSAVDSVVSANIASRANFSHAAPSPVIKPIPCPAHGCSGRLDYWPVSSALVGASVIGCSICRYSRIAS